MTENAFTPLNSEKSTSEEVAAKPHETKSPDEAKTIAAENGKEQSDDRAQHLSDRTHDENPSTGKLSDEELEAASGGAKMYKFFWDTLYSLPYKDEIYDYVTFYQSTTDSRFCYERLAQKLREHGDNGTADWLLKQYSWYLDVDKGDRVIY